MPPLRLRSVRADDVLLRSIAGVNLRFVEMKKIRLSVLLSLGLVALILGWLGFSGRMDSGGAMEAPAPSVAASASQAPGTATSSTPAAADPFAAQLAKQKQSQHPDANLPTVISDTKTPVPLGRDPFGDFLQQQRNAKVSPFVDASPKP